MQFSKVFEADSDQEPPSKMANYPYGLDLDIQPHAANAIREQLDRHAPKLFCVPGFADVHMYQICRPDEGFQPQSIHSEYELEDYLHVLSKNSRPDPRCRYMFIKAKTARSRLHITNDMFLQLLTYHRVMPAFLEYIFPFGVQDDRRDAYGGTFRTEPRMGLDERGYQDLRLGRSGRHLEFCYCLQSVERVKAPRASWSVRMCAVWHTFDLERERQAWIIVKANSVIENAVKRQTEKNSYDTLHGQSGLGRAFRLSLMTNLEIATWSIQNWHWYLNSLEEELQTKTRQALMPDVNIPNAAPTQRMASKLPFSRASTVYDKEKPPPQTDPASTLSKRRFSLKQTMMRMRNVTVTEVHDEAEHENHDLTEKVTRQPQFSFRHLQDLEKLEESANDAKMITTSNLRVLRQIRQEYSSIFENQDSTPPDLRDCRADFLRFARKLTAFETEFELFHERIQTFSHLLQERKALLYGILEYRNMQANIMVSERAQDSAQKMEALTEEMHRVAQKTQTETVSMRVITVVTLLFLPGTFISTLMSTPIVAFDRGDPSITDSIISAGALKLFCAVSIPLMCITVAAWYVIHRQAKEREELMNKMFHERLSGASIQ